MFWAVPGQLKKGQCLSSSLWLWATNKTTKIGQTLAFLVIWAQYWSFWLKWCPARPKHNADEVPRWFSDVWVPKLLLSPIKIWIICPKTTKFGPKLAFLVNLGQAMQAYSMPCCGSVGGCGARAVSRKTPIYFILWLPLKNSREIPQRKRDVTKISSCYLSLRPNFLFILNATMQLCWIQFPWNWRQNLFSQPK